MIRILLAALVLTAPCGAALAGDSADAYDKNLAKASESFTATVDYWAKLPQPPTDPKVAKWTAQLIIDELVMEFAYPDARADEVSALRARIGKDFGSWPVATRLLVLQELHEQLHSDKYKGYLEMHYASSTFKSGVPNEQAGMTHTLPLAIKTRSAHLCYRLVYPDGELPSTTAGGVDVKDGDLHALWMGLRKLETSHPQFKDVVADCLTIRDTARATEQWEEDLAADMEYVRKWIDVVRIEENPIWKAQQGIWKAQNTAGKLNQAAPNNAKAVAAMQELPGLQARLTARREKLAKEFSVPAHLAQMSKYRKPFEQALDRDLPAVPPPHTLPAFLREKIVGISIPEDFTYGGIGNVNRGLDAWIVVKPRADFDELTKAHGWCVALQVRFNQQKSGADSWSAPKLGGVGAAVRFECKRFKR